MVLTVNNPIAVKSKKISLLNFNLIPPFPNSLLKNNQKGYFSFAGKQVHRMVLKIARM